MNSDGSGVVMLTKNGSAQDASTTWSPNGKRIAWTSNRNPENDYEVFTMNASDGGDGKRVTSQWGFDGRCSWDRKR